MAEQTTGAARPDPGGDGVRIDPDALARRVAARVGEVSGVVGLEPTVLTGLRGDVPDGVSVSVRSDMADVDVSLRTSGDVPARRTAVEVHRQVLACLAAESLTPGDVDVVVLVVEPAPVA